MAQKSLIRRNNALSVLNDLTASVKPSQPDAAQNSHRSSILRLNPTLQRTCPPLTLSHPTPSDLQVLLDPDDSVICRTDRTPAVPIR
jgi:hypothetical protein